MLPEMLSIDPTFWTRFLPRPAAGSATHLLLRGTALVFAGLAAAGFGAPWHMPLSSLSPIPVQEKITVELPQGGDIEVPMPEGILRAIVPLSAAAPDATFKEILEQGRVEKWTKSISIVLLPDTDADKKRLAALMQQPGLPLLREIVEKTGIEMRTAKDARDVDVVIVFAADAEARRRVLPLANLRDLLTSPIVGISDAFAKSYQFDESDCLQLLSKSVGEIYGALGFISTRLSPAEQETCLARTFLHIMGLQGEARMASAGNPGHPADELSPLDQLSLELLYQDSSKPNLIWRDALKPSPSAE